ncbi:unnamed protein product, partial [Staurois parvus]
PIFPVWFGGKKSENWIVSAILLPGTGGRSGTAQDGRIKEPGWPPLLTKRWCPMSHLLERPQEIQVLAHRLEGPWGREQISGALGWILMTTTTIPAINSSGVMMTSFPTTRRGLQGRITARSSEGG